ncbi:GNAT family N-acetyltransferase [Ectobacillus sp. JY-23]|uniref:GNAT family N-acetyltransferase n=1 Tax=Ectobacillus sp. JY-23 TaxID=2933872 RepID=UPI001FF652C0|nr:GNAT family N-acetyltransferase [Ectobacillus sp. JY-23]UOY91026.1 GNAT family N-acetyltransferase [Ectobacillus sp. JY-23]
MEEIRRLETETELRRLLAIATEAYPGAYPQGNTEQVWPSFKRQVEEPSITMYGLYRNDLMVGGMRLHDFSMNWNGIGLDVGGVGMVCVDFHALWRYGLLQLSDEAYVGELQQLFRIQQKPLCVTAF